MKELIQTTKSSWDTCLQLIYNNVGEQQFNTWFAPIRQVDFDEEKRELTLCVPSSFIYEYHEAHYTKLLRFVLSRVYGQGVRLMYKVTTDATTGEGQTWEGSTTPAAKAVVNTIPANQAPQPLQTLDSQLKPEYTFDNFVPGDSNKLPLAVGQAIAQNPKQATFNPLFLYGPSGCGKTHLVTAIGARLKELHPEMRVLYVSAHLFQIQYTDSIRRNTFNDFIAFYQSIDALIIDDVQEFAAHQKTQLAFFHIFNHLHQNGRQLILTSDRPPVALQGMEERLLTRFKWGLLAELERPDEELRRDILRSKIRHDGLRFSDDVINYIARVVDKSVRDLEGIIHSLLAYSVVLNHPIDIQLAQNVIARTIGLQAQKHPLTVDEILDKTCTFFNLDREEVLSKSRKASVVLGRQVAMFLTQKHTTLSTTKIGAAIGRRNHATVLHSCQSISNRLKDDTAFSERIGELEAMLKA